MNLLEAIEDEDLFRGFLGESLATWRPWLSALRFLYGLPTSKADRKLIRQCTGRKKVKHTSGFDTALLLTGRRSGKSRMAAVIAAYEAVLAGHEEKLAAGEVGVVACTAPTKSQAKVVFDYISALFRIPVLAQEVKRFGQFAVDLKNGNRIEVLDSNWKTVRGRTLLCCVADELAFMGLEEAAKVRNDTELVRALQPGLATVGGRLIGITTPYARKGWVYRTWKKHWGNEEATTLVWNCASRVMNPTLPKAVVEKAMKEDLQAAKSEYFGEFRDDVAEWLPRAVIEQLVVKGRKESPWRGRAHYLAFCDLSGGRGDDAALALAHKEDTKVVLDLCRRWKPPFNPHSVIREMAQILRDYKIPQVTGDNYAAEFVALGFVGQGIVYRKCDRPKSTLYTELLPIMCSGGVELLDQDPLVDQLAGLERRTRSGGKDTVDHGHGAHDDMANVVAGVVTEATRHRVIVGGLDLHRDEGDDDESAFDRRQLGAAMERARTWDFDEPFKSQFLRRA